MSTKTIYGFDDLGNKVAIGSYNNSVTVTLYPRVRKDSSIESGTIHIFGSISGDGDYDEGTFCTIEAPSPCDILVNMTSYNGVSFSRWEDEQGNTISSSNPYTFTVNSNTTLYATYVVVNEQHSG